jgi:hypothetical protein
MSYSTITADQQDQIDQIMDNFDFHKVQRYMDWADWKWWSTEEEGGGHVPDVSELRQSARRTLKSAFVEKLSYTGSGGLSVVRYSGEDEQGPWERVRLIFELEEWNTLD